MTKNLSIVTHENPDSPEPHQIKKVQSEPLNKDFSLNNSGLDYELEGTIKKKISKNIANKIDEVNNEEEEDRFIK